MLSYLVVHTYNHLQTLCTLFFSTKHYRIQVFRQETLKISGHSGRQILDDLVKNPGINHSLYIPTGLAFATHIYRPLCESWLRSGPMCLDSRFSRLEEVERDRNSFGEFG